eukprot:TRINITY_DN4767_c0_g1_i1.p1 TRINITY_DN4767_c0_g1~~TRINITY_DN4767_c0_g1_i1.p1  ORF type:complete len:187 (+),score=52.24 TRINITY_DN4767_c0_g1_i1:23-562(+)
MKAVLVVVSLALLALSVTGLSSNCGGPCANNNDCINPTCSRCNATAQYPQGVCVNGYKCGQNCNVDTDCSVVYGCDVCQGNVCQANPNGCGATCTNDNDCSDPICTHCVANLCSPGNPCGSACSVDKDCMQNGSNCNYCLKGACFSSCGHACQSDSECDPTSCSICDPNSNTCQYAPSQ